MYKGEVLTEERAAQIADETLAELANRTDEEVAAAKANRQASHDKFQRLMGRPRLGAGQSVQIRARLAPELAAELDAAVTRTGRARSDIVRDALEAYLRAS
jgi:hypothetical protein